MMPGNQVLTCQIRREPKGTQVNVRRSDVRKTRNILPQILMVLAATILPAFAQTTGKVLNTFHVGGPGGWDYVTVDAPNHRLFVTRSTHTQAIDEKTGKVLGDIPGQIRSHGVALAPEFNRGFITDGGGQGAVIIFDLKTYAVLGKIAAMPDADGIIYDAKQKVVLAVSGDGNALMTIKPDIDPKTGTMDSPIQLGGGPEFLAADGAGKVYINLEDKDMVAKVDLKTRRVEAHWSVTPGGHPVGMAMDSAKRLLFVGCRNPQKLVIMNADTGAVVDTLPIGKGVDATTFDAGVAYASAGDGTLTAASMQGGKWAVVQTVKTAASARTMGVDEITHKSYLPAAEMLPAAGNSRPQPKPDTFMIIEVGK
jgi:DNA-binding beta-propeller fold protein YncE